jgi:AraC family transcriptional regulator, ethanolamine operon transcriptional activator
MLFKNLNPSPALSLLQYPDIDAFRDSERYAGAQSIPLAPGNFSVLRASVELPGCTLSLVRTFPRIINGYEMTGRLVLVIPMDNVLSARLNGRAIEQSIVVLKGRTRCTVHEPEGRLVTILSVKPGTLPREWLGLDNGFLLLRLNPERLEVLQHILLTLLVSAAHQPVALRLPSELRIVQASLLGSIDTALRDCQIVRDEEQSVAHRYKNIVNRVDELSLLAPHLNLDCEGLADEIGVSVRTLQTAVHSVCGLPTHRYVRLRRLWSVRRQLRTGSLALTVRASAAACGFSHMGEFSELYRNTFGELPSQTLEKARHRR